MPCCDLGSEKIVYVIRVPAPIRLKRSRLPDPTESACRVGWTAKLDRVRHAACDKVLRHVLQHGSK